MGIVAVLGSLITDLVTRAPRLPQPGETVLGDDFSTFLGGKGINQAIVAARQGAKVTMIGRVGTDTYGDNFFPVLKHEGIDSTHVTRDTTVGTGVSLLVVSTESGQNMIVANPRANLSVTAEAVEAALHAVHKQRQGDEKVIFLTQCETSAISYETGVRVAHDLGMTTIWNVAPIPREPLPDDIFKLVDVLVLNETEAASLAQCPVTSVETAQSAAERLIMHGSKHIIITLGAQGCLWSTGTDAKIAHHIENAFAVKAIDATAAGDAFCGALAASLAADLPMATALRRANAAGAVAVTRMGAIASLPTLAEIEALLPQ
ncbi:MAG TPA: ribokinase [Ktedonobacteraceae bacterium]|nr:ribokinase [Ktedonobacteraceae bacterium]